MHGQLHAVTVHRQSNLPELLGARGAEQQHTITQQPSGQGSRVRAHRQPRSTGRSCTVTQGNPCTQTGGTRMQHFYFLSSHSALP